MIKTFEKVRLHGLDIMFPNSCFIQVVLLVHIQKFLANSTRSLNKFGNLLLFLCYISQ